jgi:hypothetical protein
MWLEGGWVWENVENLPFETNNSGVSNASKARFEASDRIQQVSYYDIGCDVQRM